MKRFFTAVLAAIMIFCLCSCNDAPENGEPTSKKPETTTRSTTVRLTFPEGYTVSEIAARLEENDVCSAADFRRAANDASLAENYGFEITDISNRAFLFEGYVFPDTYDFFYGESASSAIRRFLSNAENKLTDEFKARAELLGYTMDEIITIASVIQEESTLEQMSKVSSVVHNRLEIGMKLQCDVTIFYLNDSVIPFLDGDTGRYNGYYNTYKCDGLPAGPICNPGTDAIRAALYPDDTEYLFFVTDKADDTVFYYAETHEKHLDNCDKAGW